MIWISVTFAKSSIYEDTNDCSMNESFRGWIFIQCEMLSPSAENWIFVSFLIERNTIVLVIISFRIFTFDFFLTKLNSVWFELQKETFTKNCPHDRNLFNLKRNKKLISLSANRHLQNSPAIPSKFKHFHVDILTRIARNHRQNTYNKSMLHRFGYSKQVKFTYRNKNKLVVFEYIFKLIKLSYARRVVYFLSMFLYPQHLLSLTIRDLKMLESSGFHQNVDLSVLLNNFISHF